MTRHHSSDKLSMAQVKADIFMARSAINEAGRLTPKAAKYIKGQAGYHLQQAAEKMIKIQIYAMASKIDNNRMYKHPLGDLINYAEELGIKLDVPNYVLNNREVISGWEANGRYDISIVVRMDTLNRCMNEVEAWYDRLMKTYR